jgi:SAM-dependent methyltransferase
MLKDKLRKFYTHEMYFPTLLSLFINPFYFARKGLYKNIKDLSPNVTGRTLDVGCGLKPYESLYKSEEYIGLEYDSPENRQLKKADYFYDGIAFPFDENSFDSVVANEVFEHVFNPNTFLDEVNRILKKDGILFMTMPFVWDEHEQPFDYARYTSFGIKSILEKHGFEVMTYRKSINDIRVIFQLLNLFIWKKLRTKNSLINHIIILLLIFPFNLIGELLNLFFPKNSDLYLDNIILARKVKID